MKWLVDYHLQVIRWSSKENKDIPLFPYGSGYEKVEEGELNEYSKLKAEYRTSRRYINFLRKTRKTFVVGKVRDEY